MSTDDVLKGRSLLRQRPWRDVVPPPDVLSIPTMLAVDELALLYTLARDYATGEGAIVDAGCFLGGSSAALLAGLRDRDEKWQGPPVVSYDLFRVEQYTLAEYFSSESSLAVGASFRHLYDHHMSGYDMPHDVREGDIAIHGWDGQPIEVLFLDVLKTPAINSAVLNDFLPYTIPGRTVIVHQDYGWGEVPWLHITVELMRDSLSEIDQVPYCTHAFLLERAVDAGLYATDIWNDTSQSRKLELMDQAIARSSGDTRGMLELSKAVLLIFFGSTGQAAELVAGVGQRYDSPSVILCKDVIEGYLN